MPARNIDELKQELVERIMRSDNPSFLAELNEICYLLERGEEITPMTWQELYDKISEAEAEIEAGKVISQEDLEKEAENW